MTDAPDRELRNLDLGPDPLDPHGDGIIRKGDPMYDLMMSGDSFIANMNDDGTWDVTVTGDPLPDDTTVPDSVYAWSTTTAGDPDAAAQRPRTPADGPYQARHAAPPPAKRWWERLLGL